MDCARCESLLDKLKELEEELEEERERANEMLDALNDREFITRKHT